MKLPKVIPRLRKAPLRAKRAKTAASFKISETGGCRFLCTKLRAAKPIPKAREPETCKAMKTGCVKRIPPRPNLFLAISKRLKLKPTGIRRSTFGYND